MIATFLCLGFVLPLGSIALDIYRDAAAILDEAEAKRLTAPLPAPRRDLSGWPVPLSPLDLPGIGNTEALAATVLAPRVAEGRHRLGVAVGTEEQTRLWNSPTGQFWRIVDGLADLWEPCSHCAAPEDGEPAHAGCPGCSCPCSLVEAVA